MLKAISISHQKGHVDSVQYHMEKKRYMMRAFANFKKQFSATASSALSNKETTVTILSERTTLFEKDLTVMFSFRSRMTLYSKRITERIKNYQKLTTTSNNSSPFVPFNIFTKVPALLSQTYNECCRDEPRKQKNKIPNKNHRHEKTPQYLCSRI